jgi:hypothetical protein
MTFTAFDRGAGQALHGLGKAQKKDELLMASKALSDPASVSRHTANGLQDDRRACTAELPNAVAIRPFLLVQPSLVSRYAESLHHKKQSSNKSLQVAASSYDESTRHTAKTSAWCCMLRTRTLLRIHHTHVPCATQGTQIARSEEKITHDRPHPCHAASVCVSAA